MLCLDQSERTAQSKARLLSDTGSVWILTPKALANFSPAVRAQREPWDSNKQSLETLKGFAIDEPLQGLKASFVMEPRVLANPGLTLANAFGVKSKLNQ